MKLGYEVYKNFIQRLFERLKESFGEEVILSIAVFGSVARGQARPDSDIDLLIVHKQVDFNPTGRFVKLFFELKEEAEYKRLKKSGLDPYPSPLFMSEQALWERPLILLDIIDHGLILYDTGILRKRLDTLKKRLSELGSKKVVLENGRWYWDLKPDWKPGEVIKL